VFHLRTTVPQFLAFAARIPVSEICIPFHIFNLSLLPSRPQLSAKAAHYTTSSLLPIRSILPSAKAILSKRSASNALRVLLD